MNHSLTATQFWMLNCVVVIAFILILTNISLFLTNRAAQIEINSRQQYIEESVRLNKLSNQLIQSLANLAAQTNDQKIAGVLSAHGIQYTIKSPVANAKKRLSEEAVQRRSKVKVGKNQK